MSRYIHQSPAWPRLHWNQEAQAAQLAAVRHRQGRLIGRMEALGFSLRKEAELETLTLDVLKSSEIEGENLNPEQVRSSVARRLGMDIAGAVPADRHVEGVVAMMLDATQNFDKPLTAERLFGWQAALFPTGRSGHQKIAVGAWRDDVTGPMQVVSGPMGRESVHYEAPAAHLVDAEMTQFITWANQPDSTDPVLRSALAHLWFVTIHPFEDGNGRIARAIAYMQLARADDSPQRFYSMSSEIRKERNDYYEILEKTQKGDLDVSEWLQWFLNCLDRALLATSDILSNVMKKARFWEKYLQANLNERQQLMLNKMLDRIEGKMTSSKGAKMAKCSQDTATRDIQDLMDKGILEKEPAGGRSTSYILREI